MKALLKILGIFILIIAIAIGASILLLPKERIIEEVKTAFRDQTGRTLDFSNDVSLSFYPKAGIIIKDVSLDNAQWATADHMVNVEQAEVILALRPLLDKEIVVERFVLESPVIRLERAENGRANWEFNRRENTSAAVAADTAMNAGLDVGVNAQTQQTEDQTSVMETAGINSAKLKPNLIEIRNGKVIYRNDAKQVIEEVKDIDLLLNIPDLEGTADLDGDMTFKGEEFTLDATLDDVQALLSGRATPATLDLTSEPMDIAFEGRYSPKEKYLLDGNLDTSVRSLTRIAQLTGVNVNRIALPFDSFEMKMQGRAGLQDLIYDAFNFQGRGINVSGKGRVSFADEKPFFGGTYNFDHIDINRFITAPEKTPVQSEKLPEGGDQKAGALAESGDEWSDAPINYKFLRAINTNITANVEKYTYDGITFGPNTLQLEIKDQAMEINISDTPIFGGTLNQTTILETGVNPPTIRVNAKMKNIQARDAFSYLADYDRLSGKMDATLFNVTANARSLKSIADSLAGTVDYMFKDGEIRGVNVIEWAKAFQNRYANINPSYEATPFVSLNGTFNIANGIARNGNMKLRGPLANANGSGLINVGEKTLNYDVNVTLLETNADVPTGVSMPFDVIGPWSKPKIRPDISNLIQNTIKNPEQAREQLRGLKETGKALEDELNNNENVKAIKDLIKSF